jgi:Fe-S-cluster-containing hydrogenase component 2/CRP-like cAMP-binding protein
MADDFELFLSDEPDTARDEDGRVKVQEKDARKRLEKTVTVTIDGVQVPGFPEVVPARDERGLRRYKDGLPLLRFSTVYDVGRFLVNNGTWTEEELNKRIPVLCHREYLDPIAVCRVCSVNIEIGRAARKLLPACQHRVGDNYVIHTRGERVRDDEGKETEELTKLAQEINRAQTILTQMLMGDHFHPDEERDSRYKNELEVIAGLLGVNEFPFPRKTAGVEGRNVNLHPQSRRIPLPMAVEGQTSVATTIRYEDPTSGGQVRVELPKNAPLPEPILPYSSRSITVDHDNCILCDRCVRACTEIKKFKIIGHTGKGSKTRISFDLDLPMDDSHCVQCGECMTNCPTGALVLKRRVRPRTWSDLPQEIEDPSVDLPDQFVSSDEFELLNLMFDADALEGIDNGQRVDRLLDGLERSIRGILNDPEGWKNSSSREKLNELDIVLPEELSRAGEDVMKRISAKELNSFRLHFTGIESRQLRQIASLFRQVPYPYLRWNEGAIRYRQLKAGELLCKQDEFGSTAYLLMSGRFELWIRPKDAPRYQGFFSRFFSFGGKKDSGPENGDVLSDDVAKRYLGNRIPSLLDVNELILGEMACITSKARTASLRAADECVILEVTRNVLDMVQRSPAARPVLERLYKERALQAALRAGGRLFEGLNNTQQVGVTRFLAGQTSNRRTRVRRVERGEVLLKQGAGKGDFFIIRSGFVKVAKELDDIGSERILTHLSAGAHFGEIAILSNQYQEIRDELEENEIGRRTATISALDDVEVVIVKSDVFVELCSMSLDHLEDLGTRPLDKEGKLDRSSLIFRSPSTPDNEVDTLGKRFAIKSQGQLRANKRVQPIETQFRGEFVQQGLFQGQKLLILDLMSCTRCDECTRACADSHDGLPRLLRDGRRFGDFLVATSCRSCHKPYCMDGCPVDAIHRVQGSLEIRIENHCIGCGLCERQCPYGSIHMTAVEGQYNPDGSQKMTAETRKRAVNCNLCEGLIAPEQDPFCVAACPHDAAFRWTGEDLMDRVTYRETLRQQEAEEVQKPHSNRVSLL